MSDINSYNAGLAAAYTPTEWATGDTITAEKLNNIENGVDSVTDGVSTLSARKITVTYDNNQYEADITLEELVDIVKNRKPCYLYYDNGNQTIILEPMERDYYNDSDSGVAIYFPSRLKYSYGDSSKIEENLFVIEETYNSVYVHVSTFKWAKSS